jgi:propionyl-CoA synthetase
MTDSFDDVYDRSMADPEAFWADAASGIDWIEPWTEILDRSNPPHFRWFTGGVLNTCYNCVDRHVEAGRGDQAAIIYDSALTDAGRTLSYSDLLDQVSRFAGALAAQGVGKGDRVILYMPMVPEAVVAALACARIGAVHSIVFGGFAANELAVRIDDCTPKVIVTASCGIEPTRTIAYKPLLDEAIALAGHTPDACIILQRPQVMADLVAGRDFTWDDAMAAAQPAGCVPVAATDPLYILYTSGTTGAPKGVVRDNGGHAVALKWSMPNIYDIAPGEVYWAASDVGWVVGHSYIIYAPLLHGSTSVLYEGKPVGTPDPGAFWRVIAEHAVSVMFTAPTAIRAIRQQDPEGKLLADYDLSGLRALFLAGERCDPDTLEWLQQKLGIPIIDHWWQTETGWAIASNCLGIEQLPVIPGSPTRPCPGWDVRVLDPDGAEMPAGGIGAICVKTPLPPSAFPTLWNADDRYRETYFSKYPGYYETGDSGMKDANGYIHVMARTDDVINVAGHRLSTGAIEEVLAAHPNVAECAVIGAADALKGQLPVGFLVLNAGANQDPPRIVAETVQMVRDRIGAVAAFKSAIVVARLPKTRSGKILRATMKKIADGEEYGMPATIEDAAVLPEIAEALAAIGYPAAD